MSNGNFTVMIAGRAKLGMENYVKRYLKELMDHSRKDKDCIVYNIHESIENPGEFMVYMQWKNKQAFEQHNLKPELQEFKHNLAVNMFEEQSPKTYWHSIEE